MALMVAAMDATIAATTWKSFKLIHARDVAIIETREKQAPRMGDPLCGVVKNWWSIGCWMHAGVVPGCKHNVQSPGVQLKDRFGDFIRCQLIF